MPCSIVLLISLFFLDPLLYLLSMPFVKTKGLSRSAVVHHGNGSGAKKTRLKGSKQTERQACIVERQAEQIAGE